MNKSFPVQIYPSQLQSFKEKTNELAEAIAEALTQKKLSGFKRNDYVSIGIGYKSHDDLIDWANSRKQADKGQPLLLFVEPQICNSINEVLCNKIEALNTETCSLILSSLGQKELGRKIISDIKTNVAPLFSDKYLHEGSPTLKRLNSYFSALAGLKMQAGVAALGLTKKDLKVDRSELGNAQQLMSKNIKAVNHIVKIVSELNTTVPDLSEQQLKEWLIESDIHFSHLSKKPFYYASCKVVGGTEYYFITQYYDDGEGCAGHSYSRDEAIKINLKAADNGNKLIAVDVSANPLTPTLAFPDLCSDIYIAEKAVTLYIDEANEIPSDTEKMLMRDNSALDPNASHQQVVANLHRMIPRNNIIVLTGVPASGKSMALSKVVETKFISNQKSDLLKGNGTALPVTDIAIPAKSSKIAFAVDEAQVIPNDELIRLVELSFEHQSTLLIVCQTQEALPINAIKAVVKKNSGSISNLHIHKLGLPQEYILCDHSNTRSPHESPDELNKMKERIKKEGRHNDIKLMGGLKPDELWTDEKSMKEHSLHLGQKTNNLAFEVNLDESPLAPILPDSTLADMIQMVESCWPEGATCATQEADGEILYWSANVQDVLKARQIANTDDGLMPHVGFKYQVDANYYEIAEQAYVASNWKTSVVTPIDVNF